jgi:hypothetical protein
MRCPGIPLRSWKSLTAASAAVALAATGLVAAPADHALGASGPMKESVTAPSREVLDVSIDRLTGRCGFPVLAHWEGRVAVISFTDGDGQIVKTIEPVAGRLDVTVTNLATGKTLELHASGPGIGEQDPDFGFLSFTTLGSWLVFQDPVTLQRGVFLIEGRRVLTSEGFDFHGRVVDLCPELAPSTALATSPSDRVSGESYYPSGNQAEDLGGDEDEQLIKNQIGNVTIEDVALDSGQGEGPGLIQKVGGGT